VRVHSFVCQPQIWFISRNAHPVKAFLSSCLYLFFMLAGACWGLHPTLLPATTGTDRDITLCRAISGLHTLTVGLVWWGFGMALAVAYVVFVYSKFRGKLVLDTGGVGGGFTMWAAQSGLSGVANAVPVDLSHLDGGRSFPEVHLIQPLVFLLLVADVFPYRVLISP
jgi:hypothetical protein